MSWLTYSVTQLISDVRRGWIIVPTWVQIRRGHVWRMFQLSLLLITFRSRTAKFGLPYLQNWANNITSNIHPSYVSIPCYINLLSITVILVVYVLHKFKLKHRSWISRRTVYSINLYYAAISFCIKNHEFFMNLMSPKSFWLAKCFEIVEFLPNCAETKTPRKAYFLDKRKYNKTIYFENWYSIHSRTESIINKSKMYIAEYIKYEYMTINKYMSCRVK